VQPKIQYGKEYIRFQLGTKSDYDKMTAYCIQAKYQFATVVPKKDSPKTHQSSSAKTTVWYITAEIHRDLTDVNFPVISVAQMHGKYKVTKEKIFLPLFLVTLQKPLNVQEIYNLDYLLYRIKVERYIARE